MIAAVKEEELAACAEVIQKSFLSVAKEFGLTRENAPRFTAFATTKERLILQFEQEKRPMFAYYNEGTIVGYYSLVHQNETECELSNLCVLEEYRNKGIGVLLFKHACLQATIKEYHIMNIGIVEENTVLRKWYEQLGAVHIGTKKYDFFPFTCGYMKKHLS